MAKTLAEWAKTQVRKPTDKISALDKLRAPFIINEYETWGELYDAVNIKPPVKKPAKKKPEPEVKESKPKSSDDIKNNIDRLNIIINKQREALKALALDDPEFKQTEAAIKKTQSEIKANTKKYDDALTIEAKAEAEQLLIDAEEEIKYAQASGDKKEITQATDALNKAKKDVETTTKAAAEIGTTKGEKTPLEKTAGETAGAGTAGQAGGTAGAADAGGTAGAGKAGGDKGKTPQLSDEEQRVSALDVAATDFSLPETIFKNIPSLNRILKQYVDENWTEAKLRKAIRDDNWYRKNSAEIKARYVQKFNYDDLVASGQADGSTDYEMQISKIERSLAKRAAVIGSSAANDPTALRQAAENLYITNRSEDTTYVDDFLAASIKPMAGMIGGKVTQGYSGEALKNYNAIVQAARQNGFQVADIIPGGASVDQVLSGIASGTIDVNRVVADARKLASQGQPQYVRDLLAQGYNLDQVFKPYRTAMANVLEIGDPDQIDLNDPLLRSAITDKGDMNLYDFKKALKTDNRWQYTEQARKDVSTAALSVLRDFGFQG